MRGGLLGRTGPGVGRDRVGIGQPSGLTRTSVLRKRLLNRPLEPAAEQANRVGSAMAHNFLACDRDQAFLLPPDPRDWLPADHLVWFVLDVVDQLDLGRFRVRHQQALAELLVASLKLCAAAGLVRLGPVALDGTKVEANAAAAANRTLAKLEGEVAQMLREAAEADRAEDLEHGRARGDQLPAELATPSGRLARLQRAKALLEAEAAERQRRYETRVEALAAAARARGQRPQTRYPPRRG